MLPAKGRLRHRREFERVYTRGKRLVTPGFTLHVYRRSDEEPSRLGFVGGRRFGSIAARNRLKRRLRGACRLLWERMRRGYDLVFVVRDALPKWSGQELSEQVQRCLMQANLLESVDRETEHETRGNGAET